AISFLPSSLGTKVTVSLAVFSLTNFKSWEWRRKSSTSRKRHCPFLSIPMGTISYLFLSIASMMLFAERRDTSCSADLPPKSTPTLSFFFIGILKFCIHARYPKWFPLFLHLLLNHILTKRKIYEKGRFLGF